MPDCVAMCAEHIATELVHVLHIAVCIFCILYAYFVVKRNSSHGTMHSQNVGRGGVRGGGVQLLVSSGRCPVIQHTHSREDIVVA